MRITLSLSDDRVAQLRAVQAQTGIKISRLVEQLVEDGLKRGITLRIGGTETHTPARSHDRKASPRVREEIPVCEECATELREENTDAQGEHLNCPLRKQV